MRPGAGGVARMVMSGVAAAALAGGLVTSLAFPAAAVGAAGAGRHGPRVLLVGTFHGVPGRYRSIQAAVNAARRGDWILVAPGQLTTTRTPTRPARSATRPWARWAACSSASQASRCAA